VVSVSLVFVFPAVANYERLLEEERQNENKRLMVVGVSKRVSYNRLVNC
jgi:hypothetical protein